MEYLIINGELCHHGIKGQKWGVRRFQNSDGTYNEAGKRRYFGGFSQANKMAKQAKEMRAVANGRPSDASQRSKNKMLDSMNGRKINASYETRRARGEKLVKQGRSGAGAVGRYFGRAIAAGAAAATANFALSAVSANSSNPNVKAGAAAVSKMINGAMLAYDVSSIIRTYQDISDMRTYKDSKRW